MRPADLEKTATAVSAENGTERRDRIDRKVPIYYRQYQGEQDLELIMTLVDNELSEPYSIFTYRYFLHSWPQLCWLAFDGQHCFGTVVSKQDKHGELLRGYIAMLVVESRYRGLGVGTELVKRTIQEMIQCKADEVVLEAEVTNKGALGLYQNLGFIRDKYLIRYYLSGNDAFRLKLMLPLPPERLEELRKEQLAAEQLSRMSLEPLQPSQEVPSVEEARPIPSDEPEGSNTADSNSLQIEGTALKEASAQEKSSVKGAAQKSPPAKSKGRRSSKRGKG